MPLTDAAIRTAKPSQKAVKLSDEKGLYLEVAPSGGKWWRLKYRFGGKEKRISLDVYPDVGLKLAANPPTSKLGEGLVKAMPIVMKVLSTVGIAAMLWVGGHILLVGINDLGWPVIYDFVHHWEVLAAEAAGGFVGWLVNTLASAVLGLVAGGIVVLIMHLIPRKKKAAAAH